LHQILFEEYFFHRATLQDLAQKFHRSREWVQEQIHQYEPKSSSLEPRSVVLVIDATYFGKRGRGFGLLVAKDSKTRLPISYRFIQSETLREYDLIRQKITEKGFVIQAVTIDGRRGLYGLFEPLPVQMCHFHQQQIMTRYLTRNPKSEAAKTLKRIASYLGKVSECRFRYLLDAWHRRYEAFLEERTPDESKRGWHYTHKRLRSAYRSLKSNLPYLFTYRKYPKLNIPNTTNALDGGLFSPLKDLLKVHRGIGDEMKKKLIVAYLENLRIQQPKNPL